MKSQTIAIGIAGLVFAGTWVALLLGAAAPEGAESIRPRDLDGEVEPSEEVPLMADFSSRIKHILVGSLEPEERRVLVLRELDGRRYRDISQELGVPIGTVKSRLSRARRALRLALEPSLLLLLLLSLAALAVFRPHLTTTVRRVLAIVTANK